MSHYSYLKGYSIKKYTGSEKKKNPWVRGQISKGVSPPPGVFFNVTALRVVTLLLF